MKLLLNATLQKEDIISFNKLYGNFVKRKQRIGFLLLALVSFGIILFEIHKLILGSVDFWGLTWIPIYTILIIMCVSRFVFIAKRPVYKLIKNPENQQLFKPYTIDIDNNQIIITKAGTISKIQWIKIVKIFKTPKYIALFDSKNSMILIPRHLLTLKELEEFDDFLMYTLHIRDIISIK